jgi:selenocysteine-specific translation elongation factor
MEGLTIGVFGTDSRAKGSLLTALAKKSEAEGITVYHRSAGGRKISFLDDPGFPEKIQGYARIASICDYAFYMFPSSGRMTAADGELALLVDAFRLRGRVVAAADTAGDADISTALKGTSLSDWGVERRLAGDSAPDLAGVAPSRPPPSGTLVYIDRAFSVKGVGTVALGFVLSGQVSVHDRLRAVPSEGDVSAEVRGIQVNDEDVESAGRGIRVGLSLKGVEPSDLARTSWLDDGSFRTDGDLELEFARARFYRGEVAGRSLHVQLSGQMLPAALSAGPGGTLAAQVQARVPRWPGMVVGVIDLNGKGLRVAGGGLCKA